MNKEYIENKLKQMRKRWVIASADEREWILRGANILKEKLKELEK